MPNAKYLICVTNGGRDWSWKLIAPNGVEIALGCLYYKTKAACMRAIEAVRKHAKTYRLEEEC